MSVRQYVQLHGQCCWLRVPRHLRKQHFPYYYSEIADSGTAGSGNLASERIHYSPDCRPETVNWSIVGCCSGTADSGMAYPEIADSGKAVPETECFPESGNYFRVWQSGYRTGYRIYIEAAVLFHSLRNT